MSSDESRTAYEDLDVAFELGLFQNIGLDEPLLRLLIQEHEQAVLPELERYWAYYRNPSEQVEIQDAYGRRSIRSSAQARGLPPRLTGISGGGTRKEIVIENDIAWRIQTLAEYLAGREITVYSRAADAELREAINELLGGILARQGGSGFVQEAALLASIYGHVDFLLRSDALFDEFGFPNTGTGSKGSPRAPSNPGTYLRQAMQVSSLMTIETVEAPKAIPLLSPADYTHLDAYVMHYRRLANRVEDSSVVLRLGSWFRHGGEYPKRAEETITEIVSNSGRQVYVDEELVFEGHNPLGRVPVVHIQNEPQPLFYEGIGDVEPLIPLQDELNTRLSDRANRITLQSFRMYLGKGIEGFGERPVGPGQMWMTDNPEASIEEFGGDAASPSESEHIREIREALDKTSAVSPLAAGLVRAKVGTLSSENAMRISLLGLLSKTERRRRAFGLALSQLFGLVLQALDLAGVFPTQTADRQVDVLWGPPIPEDQSRRLEDALLKSKLGVPSELILAELGYEANQQTMSSKGIEA